MTKVAMLNCLTKLVKNRPIFHSEDDLKFKFACELMSDPQVADVFLEKKRKYSE